MAKVESATEHHEKAPESSYEGERPDSISKEAFGGHSIDDLPPRYFLNYRFLGSFLSFALSYQANFLGYTMIANVLPVINDDLGPSNESDWVLLSHILGQCMVYSIVGQLTDLFGRRYFYIGGSAIGVVGSIICSRSTSLNMLIGGMFLSGMSVGIGVGSAVASGEMVPNKYRYFALGAIFVLFAPLATIGPGLARVLVFDTSQSWRWCYYVILMINSSSLFLQIFCYFPPSFRQLHQARSKIDIIKSLDYGGFVLFTGSLATLLLGISWGGQRYPWNSAKVIATIVIGGIGLIVLVVYEKFARIQNPIMPMSIIVNRNYVSLMITSSVGVMIFYALSILWPQQIAALFDASPKKLGWISCTLTAGATFGQALGAVVTIFLGGIKWQLVCACCIFTTFIGAMAAATPSTEGMAIVFSLLGGMAIGYMETITVAGGALMVAAENIGLAIGIQYAVRLGLSSLAVSIYVTILTNEITKNLPAYVLPAAIQSGLSEAAAVQVLTDIATGNTTAIELVPGITLQIIEAVTEATKVAYMQSFKKVYYTGIAFGGCAIISALAVSASKLEEVMTSEIPRKIQGIDTTPVHDEEKVPSAM